MKIKTLTLNNFRGFPGPVPQTFSLEGKNLLVYGENGSGKSSIYHALKTFFTLQHPQYLEVACNVFSGLSDHSIEVEFDDGQPAAKWTGPPDPKPWTPDIRVTQAANRRGCLDYRAVLDTNYGHGGGRINLFDIAVYTLLADYSVPVPGGSVSTIAELWANVLNALPKSHSKRAIADVETACFAFNQGFNRALTQIKLEIDSLLMELPVEGMLLDKFVFTILRSVRSMEWCWSLE